MLQLCEMTDSENNVVLKSKFIDLGELDTYAAYHTMAVTGCLSFPQ